LLAPAGERLDEGSVHARQEPVGHLDEGHLAPERRVDLTELKTDVAAADHEEPLGHLAELERRRRVDDAIADERQSGQPRRRRACRDDRVLEAHLRRLVALHAQRARALEGGAAADDVDALGLRDRREPPREPADDALALPLAQRVERDARLTELDAELAGLLGVLDQRGDVEQGFRRDAALEEAGPAQTLARVDHDGLEPQLRAAKRRRVAAGPAAHDGHVHLDDEVAHHHGRIRPYSTWPRTAHARAIRWMLPSGLVVIVDRIRSRSAQRRSSVSDMQYPGAGAWPPRKGFQ